MKRMVVIVMMLIVTTGLFAIDGNKKDNFAIGFNLSESNGNFGLGFEISSPYFAQDFLAIRGQANMDYLSNPVFAEHDEVYWGIFTVFRLGLVGVGGRVLNAFRYYGEFGGICVLPNSDLSNDDYHPGIYGLFGFEFFMSENDSNPVSYYIELGTNSIWDQADDKFSSNIDYYSGFAVGTGLRFNF